LRSLRNLARNNAWSMVMRGEGDELTETTYVPIGGTKACSAQEWHLHDFGDFDIWKRN
jgi:hypothetical protein